MGTVDLDPGPGFDMHTEKGVWGDVFLSKVNANGAYLWGINYGHEGHDHIPKISVDISGNVYLAGNFQYIIDFDPGPGEDIRESADYMSGHDLYLSKFSPAGVHQWVVTSDILGSEFTNGVACSLDTAVTIYVVGRNEDYDSFIRKYSSSGILLWVRSWGSVETSWAIDVAVDNTGNAYVIGSFYGTVDFDPGLGEDYHTAAVMDELDTYFSKFDSNGNFVWCYTFGSLHSFSAIKIECDPNGNTCVIGNFEGGFDFDLGPYVDYRHSQDGYLFITRYDPDCNFLWVHNYGSDYNDEQRSVAINDTGDLVVTGTFEDDFDIDPGPGEDIRYPIGENDAYIVYLGSAGEYIWGRTWGGDGKGPHGYDAAFDVFGHIFMCGWFIGPADFDPGPGEDIHDSVSSAAYILKLRPDGYW